MKEQTLYVSTYDDLRIVTFIEIEMEWWLPGAGEGSGREELLLKFIE